MKLKHDFIYGTIAEIDNARELAEEFTTVTKDKEEYFIIPKGLQVELKHDISGAYLEYDGIPIDLYPFGVCYHKQKNPEMFTWVKSLCDTCGIEYDITGNEITADIELDAEKLLI